MSSKEAARQSGSSIRSSRTCQLQKFSYVTLAAEAQVQALTLENSGEPPRGAKAPTDDYPRDDVGLGTPSWHLASLVVRLAFRGP